MKTLKDHTEDLLKQETEKVSGIVGDYGAGHRESRLAGGEHPEIFMELESGKRVALSMATKRQIAYVWEQARHVRGKNPNLWRRDELGNKIYKPAYGTHGRYGWEVDHRKPRSRGGTNHLRNLRALQTGANRKRGKKYPYQKK